LSEDRTLELEEIKKDTNDVHVFISYSHEDFGVAQCLQDELTAVNPDRIRCFLDAYSIRSGEEWHSKIIANLKAADWLIFIYTGRERRSYDFCGFEIGIFTSVHRLDTSRKITEAPRLLCIHDTAAVPSLLSMLQNRRIRPYQPDGPVDSTQESDFYVDSPLAQFFEDFYQYPAPMPLRRMLKRLPGGGSQLREMPNIASEIADRVKRLTIKFQEARKNDPISEKFYQVRMEIDIRDPLPKNRNEIPGRSTVTAAQETFNLLGLSPDPDESGELKTTWDQMKTSIEANNETFAWMDKVEDDILDAAHQRNLRSPELTFRAHDGQFYRPLLARQTIYGSGARKFSVIFVRTLPRKFVGDESTSALLVGLILASRFRFTFIEAAQDLMARLADDVSDAEFQLSCRQLLYDIERMEQESSEFGMNSPDLFQQAFGPENHEIVNAFYEVWFPVRKELFSLVKQRLDEPNAVSRDNIREEVRKFSNTISPYNRRFLEMCLQRYTLYLKESLRRPV
jgi:TIR domain